MCTVIDVAPRVIEKQGLTHIPVKYVTPKTPAPLHHPASEHLAEARGIPGSIELTPIAFFNLFWDDSILNKIVEATNAYALAKHAQVPKLEGSSCLR